MFLWRRFATGVFCIAALAIGALLIGSASGAPLQVSSRYDASSPDATLNADAAELTPADTTAASESFPLGATVSLRLQDASSVLSVAVPTAGDEAISLLPGGGAAVTYPAPPAPDVGPVATESVDTAASDVSEELRQDQTADQQPQPDTDPGDVPNDTPDSTSYPSGDSVAPSVDGVSIVDAAVGQTADGRLVAAALRPPRAVDAHGAPVTASLTLAQGGLVVSVSPDISIVFPVQVTLTAGFNGAFDPATDASNAGAANATAQVTCGASRPDIVVSYVTQWQNLAAALVKKPTPCATYFVLVPAAGGGLRPRGGSVASIGALNAIPTVQAAQARFEAVATFGYGAVTDGQYQRDGEKFATQLTRLGYANWAIDEGPATLLNGASDPSWANLAALVAGLSSTGSSGIVENAVVHADRANDLSGLRSYKSQLKALLNSKKHGTNFDWTTIERGTLLWAQEAYTYCSLVCVNGASLRSMASHTNAYMQHVGRLAFAADAPNTVAPAKAALQARYLAITNDWKGHDNFAYQTQSLSLRQMQGLARLQIYSERVWQTDGNPYSAPGVGLRWTDNTVNFSTAKQAALAASISSSLAGAFKPDGSALKACVARGTVSTVLCQPQAGGSFTSGWSIFRTWGRRTQSAGSCDAAGGTDIQGGPGNDNFDGAQQLSDNPTDSADGTLQGATVQHGEQLPQDQGAPAGTAWYCWTATQAAIDADVCNPGGASFTVYSMTNGQRDNTAYPDWIAVWTGDAFGSLGLVADGIATVSAPVVVGQTYLLQIANVAGTSSAPDFNLAWPLNCG